jgi:plasmid stabilization system protein ParE
MSCDTPTRTIAYDIDGDVIEILAVVHQSQQWPGPF